MRLNAVIDAPPSSYRAIGSGLSRQRFRQNNTFKGIWRGIIAARFIDEVYNRKRAPLGHQYSVDLAGSG